MPTTYPTELKVQTIRRYEKGKSIQALSQELHISQSTLYQWRKEYCSVGMPNRTYTSGTLIGLLQQHGVKQSFSASARPLDNAVAESFFSTFKREEAYRKDYISEQHFRRSAEKYIRFYNEVRPHQTLNYKTPQAFEDAYNSVLSKK